MSDDGVEYIQQEQIVQFEADSVDEHTQSSGVSNLQQSPAVDSRQTDNLQVIQQQEKQHHHI